MSDSVPCSLFNLMLSSAASYEFKPVDPMWPEGPTPSDSNPPQEIASPPESLFEMILRTGAYSEFKPANLNWSEEPTAASSTPFSLFDMMLSNASICGFQPTNPNWLEEPVSIEIHQESEDRTTPSPEPTDSNRADDPSLPILSSPTVTPYLNEEALVLNKSVVVHKKLRAWELEMNIALKERADDPRTHKVNESLSKDDYMLLGRLPRKVMKRTKELLWKNRRLVIKRGSKRKCYRRQMY